MANNQDGQGSRGQGQSSSNNSGNFANDPERAREAGRRGGSS
ncbi:MAG TPA: KGG domain-containing protein [Candidatus Paceibacterota bacterium]|jgi:general stress protein YciG|nr:KGG domain-containing protein [Candidatus Paceibacterota bacterium]